NVTEYQYDTLSRLVRLTRPDLSWQSWLYDSIGEPGKQHVRFENSKHLMRDTYFDGFNNTIKERRTGPSGSLITTNTTYYPSGLVRRVSEPSYKDNVDTSTEFAYDPLGRPVRVTA